MRDRDEVDLARDRPNGVTTAHPLRGESAQVMEVVDDIVGLEARDPASQPFCVIARPTDRELIEAATASLGLTHDRPLEEPDGHLHPRAHVEGEDVFVLAFTLDRLMKPLPVQLLAAKAGCS